MYKYVNTLLLLKTNQNIHIVYGDFKLCCVLNTTLLFLYLINIIFIFSNTILSSEYLNIIY